MNKPKKYCGNAKEIKTTYGEMILVSLAKEDLIEVVGSNNKIYYNVCIAPRKEKGKYGDTHLAWNNEYEKKEKADYDSAERQAIQDESKDIELEDIPI
jgi:hypothetical protein